MLRVALVQRAVAADVEGRPGGLNREAVDAHAEFEGEEAELAEAVGGGHGGLGVASDGYRTWVW